MALQFYFGGSGAGKSKKLHEDIIAASVAEPNCDFLLIVPDQFTMQTQMDLVLEHPNKGIMNIDVLSFGRLTHRIMEEVGSGDKTVLDDTGKSLILRKIAQKEQQGLHIMGSHLHKIGYIHEVKSAISEFMQYGIGCEELAKIAECSKSRGALYYKLKDLELLYGSFLSYIQDKFITTEETLDSLREALPKSEIIKNCVIAFDGFTGFTPIQYRVIQELIRLTKRVIVTITIDSRENPYYIDGEQKLFHLSKKTVADLKRLGEEVGSELLPAVVCRDKIDGKLPRFADSPELAHLEQSLFRYPILTYQDNVRNIHLIEASTPKEEVRQTCIEIHRLLEKEKSGTAKNAGIKGQNENIDQNGLHYRDIAVVTGNMETYENDIEEEFAKFGIPVYMDRTRGILYNPFTEYIRSALQIILQDFSREAVFHYLRAGLCGFERSEIDRLENYVRRFGICGRKRWSELFVYKEEDGDEGVERLAEYNRLREALMEQLSPLLVEHRTAGELVHALYDFMVKNELQQKLVRYEKQFENDGELVRANEYGQIYGLVIDLLDQIESLLNEEEMGLREFADILDAGFAEITVGTIPQNVDRVVIGDIERTRLKQVKVLFFLGLNDGNIPKNGTGGGIISDIDREFIKDAGWELAPTPRQQMYIQRLYLYLNMTKPSQDLYLSYAKVGNDGKSLRPAYLIDTVKTLFPELLRRFPEGFPVEEQLANGNDGIHFFIELLREYAAGMLSAEDERKLFTFYHSYHRNSEYKDQVDSLIDTAFYRYKDSPLSKQITKLLYGSILQNSVSRLEKYAACAYAHFLQYGLALSERKEYTFENVDMGNIFHGVLELFADKLTGSQYTWFDFPEDVGAQLLDEAIEAYAVNYGETILYSNSRNQYQLKRIRRILNQTVHTLQTQLKKGSFLPERFEMSFSMAEELDTVNIALTEEEKMKLRGRIDRIDTCIDDDVLYVKVIDYKSGSRKFDLAALYYGLQLQLVVYMNAAMEIEQKAHPDKEILPAAMLYYHIDDPMIEDGQNLTPEQLNQKLIRELRMTGVVSQNDKVVSLLDKEFQDKSDVIPVERKKDGSYSAYSSVINEEDMEIVSSYVNHKIKELGLGIIDGTISVNPCEHDGNSACTYCAYKSVCGYDDEIPGYETRKLEKLSKDEAVLQMKQDLNHDE
ncbi:MAG: helicase-exonuclease AddAB subunit AddB [Lachnospiraceae bacterium]|nr:helicase-exonuclease AddAB subunit AddB [Lachnospiraceae bacterium]